MLADLVVESQTRAWERNGNGTVSREGAQRLPEWWRKVKTWGLGLLPGLVLVFAFWALGQVQWSGEAVEERLNLREEVVWRRYQIAGGFLLYVVVCLTAWLAVLEFSLEAWRGSGTGVRGVSDKELGSATSDGDAAAVGGRSAGLDEALPRPSVVSALVVAVVTGVVLYVGDVAFHRERLGIGTMELGFGEDMRTALAWYWGTGSVIFGVTVAMLAGASVLIGPGCWFDGVGKEEDRPIGPRRRAKAIEERIDRWDRFLVHGVGFAVAGLMFMDSWMKWILMRLSGDAAAVGMYGQAMIGLLGYHTAVLVVLLSMLFVPTRVWLRSELRALDSGRCGVNDWNKGSDLPTGIVVLIVTPGIVPVAAGILWSVWGL